MTIKLLITDQNLAPVGDELVDWADLKITRNDNAPDSGQVSLIAWPEVLEQLQPGNRLVVIRDRQIWTAGPMEIPQDFQEGIGGDDGGVDAPDPGEVVVNFTDDSSPVAGHLTYPDPTKAASDPTQPTAYTATAVNAEVLLRTLVNVNAGPGARADRRIPKLVLGALSGVGTNTSLTTRFEELGKVLRSVALAGGDLTYRTRQVGNQIEFHAAARRDLTSTARFSKGLGNLRSLRYKISAPTVTAAIVGGSGEGSSRTVVEVVDAAAAASWWRIEQWVDQGGVANDANGELTKAGQEALANGAAPVEVSTVTVDTEELQAGRDYMPGDLVTVALPGGLEVAQVVRSDTLTASPDGGERVSSVIGSPDATTEEQMVALIRELSYRLSRIEAR